MLNVKAAGSHVSVAGRFCRWSEGPAPRAPRDIYGTLKGRGDVFGLLPVQHPGFVMSEWLFREAVSRLKL